MTPSCGALGLRHGALRARYDSLEADHAELGLRAEEALAGQEALSLEHRKVIQEARKDLKRLRHQLKPRVLA